MPEYPASLLQVLDGDFTEENRRKCTEASRPLLQAVEVLTTFAGSPEFAGVPARISDKVSWLVFFFLVSCSFVGNLLPTIVGFFLQFFGLIAIDVIAI